MVVEFGDDLARHQVGDGGGQFAALVAGQQFQKVGDVGGVQRLDQIVGRIDMAQLQRFGHAVHEFGLEDIVFVVAFVVDAIVRPRVFGGHFVVFEDEVRVRHACRLGGGSRKASRQGCRAGRG